MKSRIAILKKSLRIHNTANCCLPRPALQIEVYSTCLTSVGSERAQHFTHLWQNSSQLCGCQCGMLGPCVGTSLPLTQGAYPPLLPHPLGPSPHPSPRGRGGVTRQLLGLAVDGLYRGGGGALLLLVHEESRHMLLLPLTFQQKAIQRILHCKKMINEFPVLSRDVTIQALPGRQKLSYSRPGRVWAMTSRLGMGKWQIFFYSVHHVLAFCIYFILP